MIRTLCLKILRILAGILILGVIFAIVTLGIIEIHFPGTSLNQIIFHAIYLDSSFLATYPRLIFLVLAFTTVLTYLTLKKPYLGIPLLAVAAWVLFTYQPVHVSEIKEDKPISLLRQLWLSTQTTSIYRHLAPTPTITLPQHPKNLILIFAESMEKNYTDSSFGVNLIPHLSSLAAQNTTIAGYRSINGTNWTLASQVATFCGVPLRVQLRDKLGPKTQHFLPNAVCVPDLLSQAGYYTVFAGGTYLPFVGTDVFVREHHFNELWGRDELIAQHFATQNDIGLEEFGVNDSALFQFAKQKLQELAVRKQPFFIALTTLDTHFPHGYVQSFCNKTYNDTRDAIKCSDKILYDFISWCQQQPFFKDTVLVVLGDHLMMSSSDIHELLGKNTRREPYNLIIAPGIPLPKHLDRLYSQMDWAPTLLDLLGLTSAHKLGLGTSLLREDKTWVEQVGPDAFEQELIKNSPQYKHLLGL